jgi:hypothetical protein
VTANSSYVKFPDSLGRKDPKPRTGWLKQARRTPNLEPVGLNRPAGPKTSNRLAAAITGKSQDDAAKVFRRVCEMYPEVRAKCPDFKFKGQRQRDTPVTDVCGIVRVNFKNGGPKPRTGWLKQACRTQNLEQVGLNRPGGPTTTNRLA